MDSYNIMEIGACIAVVLMGLCWAIKLVVNIDKESPSKEDNKIEKKKMIKSGEHVSSLEQDGIYYKPYFDKEKGLYIPTIFAQRNIVYYQLIPLNVLSDIHNYFAEEINESLMKNNKENNNG